MSEKTSYLGKSRLTDSGASRRSSIRQVPALAASLLDLQRMAGNQAVGSLLRMLQPPLQAKLRIGQPGDAFEREADRIADAVVGMAAPRSGLPGIERALGGEGGGADRRCACCGSACGANEAGKPAASGTAATVQRKCQCQKQDKDDELMQGNEAPGEAPRVPAGFTAELAGLRGGGGAPLSPALRGFFEPRIGHDFGAVRLHTGALAERSAEAVHARAFTLGNDVVFGHGEFAPDTPAGRRLLAHELTHVIQQTSPGARRQPLVQRAPDQDQLPESSSSAAGGESRQSSPAASPAGASAGPAVSGSTASKPGA
jgi:hypothetical protein